MLLLLGKQLSAETETRANTFYNYELGKGVAIKLDSNES